MRSGSTPMMHIDLVYTSTHAEKNAHDLADVSVWFEVLSYTAGAVQTQRWWQASSTPSDHTSSWWSDPNSGELAFVGLQEFDITVDATGVGDGINLSTWGFRSSPLPYPLGGTKGVQNTDECLAQGDGPSITALTSCSAIHVAVSAPGMLVRSSSQPTGGVSGNLLDPAPVSFPMAGVGKGHPTCALSSFLYQADPLYPGFKHRSLGFHVHDCDQQLLSGGQYGSAIADGAFCEDPANPGLPDQAGSVSTQSSVCGPSGWKGEFSLDTAGLP